MSFIYFLDVGIVLQSLKTLKQLVRLPTLGAVL